MRHVIRSIHVAIAAALALSCASLPQAPTTPPSVPTATPTMTLYLDPTWDSWHRDQIHVAARAFDAAGIRVRYVAVDVPGAISLEHGDSPDCSVWALVTTLETRRIQIDPVCTSGVPSLFRHVVIHELMHAYLGEVDHVCRYAGELPDGVADHHACLAGLVGPAILNLRTTYHGNDQACSGTDDAACDPGEGPTYYRDTLTRIDLAVLARGPGGPASGGGQTASQGR